jgi:disulfide bond formation protein DsbB
MRWSEIPVRVWFAALALGTFGLVAAGMELQQLLRLAPCPLCIFQRLLFLVVGALALGGALLPVARQPLAALIAAVGAGGVAVAGYQSWMQAFPHLATECGYSDPNAIERLVDWLGMQWPAMFLATGFCTSRDWVFLGLSLANWSLLAFAGVVVLAVLLIMRRD